MVEIPDGGAAIYDHRRANRRWLAKWAVYWLAVLGLYALGSLIFQSAVLYLPVLALCAANFALRALVSNPRRPFFGVRARRLTSHLLNLACTLGVLELALFTVSNGAPINDSWLAGLDYSPFHSESEVRYDAAGLEELLLDMRREPGCPLLYAERKPDISGRYNQYIRIEGADGALNRVCFLIDSNDYVEGSAGFNDYDCVHRDQIDWYAETIDALSEEEGRAVPSFVFLHIPLPAFAEARAALDAGSPEAEYLFGENGEEVNCPDRDEGFFDAILEAGSTQAVFAGHDHLNHLGVRYRGVDLVYSKSIDCVAYPGIAHRSGQRGATLIALDAGGGYEIAQLSDSPSEGA